MVCLLPQATTVLYIPLFVAGRFGHRSFGIALYFMHSVLIHRNLYPSNVLYCYFLWLWIEVQQNLISPISNYIYQSSMFSIIL